jgi:Protein of unknown function (DUF3159)
MTTVVDSETRTLLDRLGGRRGLVEGAVAPLTFVTANAILGPAALMWSAAAAAAPALVLAALRLVRREPVKPLVPGLIGLAVAVLFAARSGEARDFFLPGIMVDASYFLAFLISAVVGRPLVALVYSALFPGRADWRRDPQLRRAFMIATVAWAGMYAVRAGMQAAWYYLDRPGLLAVTKLVLGWPLTAAAVVLSLALVRRAALTRRPE